MAEDVEGVVTRWWWWCWWCCCWWRCPSDFCATFAGPRLGFTYLICLCRLNANDLDNDINRQKKKRTASGTRNERRLQLGPALELQLRLRLWLGLCVVWIVNLTAFEGSFVRLAPQSSWHRLKAGGRTPENQPAAALG